MSGRTSERRIPPAAAAGALAIALVAAGVLSAMGRAAWCACGSWAPASFDVWSRHNSQHLLDPYTFSHVQHGFVFFVFLALVLRRRPDLRFVLAIAIEAVWEIVENTPAVIERYRATTMSLDYYGDSVANAVSDLAACGLGYVAAARLPGWGTVALYLAIEIGMILTIRDSLILNVVMLVWPIEAVQRWQTGG